MNQTRHGYQKLQSSCFETFRHGFQYGSSLSKDCRQSNIFYIFIYECTRSRRWRENSSTSTLDQVMSSNIHVEVMTHSVRRASARLSKSVEGLDLRCSTQCDHIRIVICMLVIAHKPFHKSRKPWCTTSRNEKSDASPFLPMKLYLLSDRVRSLISLNSIQNRSRCERGIKLVCSYVRNENIENNMHCLTHLCLNQNA